MTDHTRRRVTLMHVFIHCYQDHDALQTTSALLITSSWL